MTALVFGASGQDGTYLVAQLAEAGERVVAAGRSLGDRIPSTWLTAGTGDGVERHSINYLDNDAMAAMIDQIQPGSIFVLAGQSSVRLSFDYPSETIRSHTAPILAVLEAVRRSCPAAHVVYANSTDVFGQTATVADETAPFAPQSPYGVGKTAGAMIVRSYRETYGLRASNAFMSNHESVLRSPDFLFGKVLAGLTRIRSGESRDPIRTGSLAVERDWGYAPEYAAAMIAMARQDSGNDFVLATGHSVLLRSAVLDMFRAFGVDAKQYLEEVDNGSLPSAIDTQHWSPARANDALGWTATTRFPDLATRLFEDQAGACL